MKPAGEREGRKALASAPSVDGKFFRVGGERFHVCGVTYGTFAETELGLFPDKERVRHDFALMAESGINTIRTYTAPDEEMLDLAEEAGLKALIGVWWDDPRYLALPTREAWKEMEGQAREAVREAAGRLAGHPATLGFVVGNEIPGQVVRWHGRRKVERFLESLYETGKDAAPDALFSYANYPTTAYLDTSCFDFEGYNVFLEDEADFRRYLSQIQVESGDRPLVLMELGLDSGINGELHQAKVLDWQLAVARERGVAGTCVFSWTDDWWVGGNKVEGWSFGLTREDRSPKPSLEAVSERYRKRLLGLKDEWPRASVVVCAYNAEETIGECIESLMALDYPDYEVIVVDDGSEDATAEVASRFPVRVVSGGRLGLSGARNLGLEEAKGGILAYIDADAMADPDWLAFLALALDAPDAAGAGGPNRVPCDDPTVARCVALSPGGPIHVLVDNERAEHVPGCNMAYWRDRLVEIGGFDPIYRAAGDDVDVCWKLQDLEYTIRFHPAAWVWHRHRASVDGFWRQQVGYGRAEALVARNHPDKFNSLGQAIWRGVIYGPASLLPGRSFIYTGRFGEAPFQRLYQEKRGMRVASVLYVILGFLALSLLVPSLAVLAALILLGLVSACLVHGFGVARRVGIGTSWVSSGALIGLLSLMQPVAREVGRVRHRRLAFPVPPEHELPFPPPEPVERGSFRSEGIPEEMREEYIEDIRDRLRAARISGRSAPAWGESDLAFESPLFWRAEAVCHAAWDAMNLRFAYRVRTWRVAALVLIFFIAYLWISASNTIAVVASARSGELFSFPVLAAGLAAIALLVAVERWLFGWKVRKALVGKKTNPR